MVGSSILSLLFLMSFRISTTSIAHHFFESGSFSHSHCVPPTFPEFIRVLPRFFAQVSTRLTVARGLRFCPFCGFSFPPTPNSHLTYLRIFSKVDIYPIWRTGRAKNHFLEKRNTILPSLEISEEAFSFSAPLKSSAPIEMPVSLIE